MIALAPVPIVSTRTTVELVRYEPQSERTALLFASLKAAAPSAGLTVRDTTTFRGGADIMLLWGAGSPLRWPAMRAQLAAGKHYITADLAYWSRYEKFRISIDAPHPQAWVMKKDWPADRLISDDITILNRWNPDGPVIVAGLGDKARVQYGAGIVDTWEAAMMAEAKVRGYTVQYRAKKGAPRPIEQVLDGAAVVVTWHSNVAVDAIRMGIPVICQDGAAAAVCQSVWPDGHPQPLPVSVRARFLANLAWWQWGTTPAEARGCWAFLREMLR